MPRVNRTALGALALEPTLTGYVRAAAERRVPGATLGSVSTGSGIQAIAARACSDGLNFWIALATPGEVLRF